MDDDLQKFKEQMKMEHKSSMRIGNKGIIDPEMIKEQLSGKLSEQDIEKGMNAVMKDLKVAEITGCLNTCCLCTGCQFGGSPVVKPSGNPCSSLMIIGKQPTEYESISGIPFSDRGGVLLSFILEHLGLRRNDIYMTYYLKCGNNLDKPSYEACLNRYIRKELEIVQPKFIITDGLTLARTMVSTGIISGLQPDATYGTIYDVACNHGSVKLMAMYELSKLLEKTGEDYVSCRNKLWEQIFDMMKIAVYNGVRL